MISEEKTAEPVVPMSSTFGKFRYLIVKPENGGLLDLAKLLFKKDTNSYIKFLESSDDDVLEEMLLGIFDGDGDGDGDETPNRKWVLFVSILARKIIAFFGKPLELLGYLIEFVLNLITNNNGFIGLLSSFFHGKINIPEKGSESFISAIGHIDGRINLYNHKTISQTLDESNVPALMDLCIMASKLAYENNKIVQNVVNLHWKMHFVAFYNCWNDYQKENSTQVFIMCNKDTDADLILISFRGTEPFDADDWSTDFDYSWYEIPNLGKVHMGFLEALGLGNRMNAFSFQENLVPNNNIESLVINGEKESGPLMGEKTAYYAVRNELKRLLFEHKNAKFVVTGHSLGGALAILFPTVLVLHKEEEVLKRLLCVYTFGQSRIGNRQLVKFMEGRLSDPVPKYFRVVYCNDLVPRLPYDDETFLYKHFGECIYYDSFYVEQKTDEEPNRNYFGLRFLVQMYLNAIWELLRSFIIGYRYGPEYKESWESKLLRVVGLLIPGISAHSPVDYVNSVRIGKETTPHMSSF